MQNDVWIIRPSVVPVFVMTVVCLPGIGLGVATFIFRDGEIYGAVIIIAAIFLWLIVGTLRLKVSNGVLSTYRFWRLRWSAPINAVIYKAGRGGDFSAFPVLEIRDKDTGHKIGIIPLTQYKSQDLQKIKALIDAAAN